MSGHGEIHKLMVVISLGLFPLLGFTTLIPCTNALTLTVVPACIVQYAVVVFHFVCLSVSLNFM